MSGMILVYTTCKDIREAKKIGAYLLKKRLCGCINIFPAMASSYFWPPHSGKIEASRESVLLIKTLADRYEDVEREILKIHSYSNPSIFALPTVGVSQKYLNWLEGEVK